MLRLISFLLFAVIVSSTLLIFIAQSRLPSLDGVVSLAELSRGASVKFDERQVPYIEAANELDLYRVQGYVTASQRLFQMDMARRSALGSLSEIFGAATLTQDKLMRTIGIGRAVKQEYALLDSETRARLDAYSQGVNSYITSNKDRLPIEYFWLATKARPWSPFDSLAVLKYSQYEQDESWRLDDLRQRILDRAGAASASALFDRTFNAPPMVGALPSLGLPSLSPAAITGSNGLVVSGRMSESRGALLALDKHHRFGLPCDWYLVSLRTPASHVAGGTIPGVPGVANGRNDRVGFGLLALKVDVQDLFLEQFSPQISGKYRAGDAWSTVSEIVEEIPVRFSDKLFFSSNLLHKVGETSHGPLLFRNDNTAVALAWTGLKAQKGGSYIQCLLKLNAATSLADARQALSAYTGSPLTALLVDTAGSCAYQQAGSVPLRGDGKSASFGPHEGCLLTPGWTGEGDWKGSLNLASLAPQVDVSKTGYFVANFMEYKPDMPLNINLFRGQREVAVMQNFAASKSVRPGLPELAVLQGDTHGALVPLVRQSLHEALKGADIIDSYQMTALEALDHWDGAVGENSPAAALYECFVRTVTRRVLAAKLGAPLTNEYLERYPAWPAFVQKILRDKPAQWLPPDERTYKNFIITSFVQSIKDMRLASATDDMSKWRWGDLHKGNFPHFIAQIFPQLDNLFGGLISFQGMRLSGDQDTVNTTESSFARGNQQFSSSQGTTMRLLIDMNDAEKFYQSLVLGQSGHFLSPARADEVRSWLGLKPLPLAFAPHAEARVCQHRLLFTDR